jgi:hypothetical protein
MGEECLLGRMGGSMKGSMWIKRRKGGECSIGQMGESILGTGLMASSMGREHLRLLMDRGERESGIMGRGWDGCMMMELCKEKLMTIILQCLQTTSQRIRIMRKRKRICEHENDINVCEGRISELLLNYLEFFFVYFLKKAQSICNFAASFSLRTFTFNLFFPSLSSAFLFKPKQLN